MTFLRNVSIRNKLRLAFGIIILIAGTASYMAFSINSKISIDVTQIKQAALEKAEAVSEMAESLLQLQLYLQMLMTEHARPGSGAQNSNIAKITKGARGSLARFDAALALSQNLSRKALEMARHDGWADDIRNAERDSILVNKLSEKFDQLKESIKRQLNGVDSDGEGEKIEYAQLSALVEKFEADTKRHLGSEVEGVESALKYGNAVFISFSAGILLVGALVTWFISLTVSHPIRLLKSFAERVGKGDLDQRVELESRDEFGLLASTFNKMVGDLRTKTASKDHLDREKLSASELRYRRLFESAKDGILILDASTGMVVDVNPFLIMLLGFSHEQFLGKAIWELGLFKDVVANEDNFAELREKEYLRYEDMPLKTIDGRQIDVEFVSNVYRVAGDKVIQCNVRDITERKRAETALKKSGLRYHSLFENMLEGYAYCRVLLEQNRIWDFLYLEVNSAFEALTGLKNVVGKKVSEVIPGIQESNPELFEIYGRVALTGHTEKYETYIESLGLWFSISVYSQEKEHFVAIFENITERKRTELEIRFNEQRYRSLVEATTAIVWDTPASGEFEVEQPSWSVLTGQSFEELRGWGWLDAIHPDDRSKTAQVWSAAFSNKSLYEVEHRLRIRDGTYRDMQVRAVPILAGDGAVLQWIGVHTDITESKEHAAQIERLRTEHEIVLNSLGEGVHWIDVDGRIKFENPAAAKMLGYEIPELIGKPAHPTMHHTRADGTAYPQSECSIYATLRDGMVRHVTDEVFWRKDGTSFPVEYICTPVYEKGGGSAGSVVIFTDITERKQAEEALRESKRFAESIAENSTSYIYLFDLETHRLAYSNRNIAELLGYSDAQIRDLGDNFVPTVMHPEDLPRIAQRHAHYAEVPDSRVFDFEYRAKGASGDWRWIWGREKVFSRRPNGDAWQLMGTEQDITERKQAQQALSLALERLQLAVKAGKAGTWELDLLTGEVDWDDQMLALYGKNVENVETGTDRWFRSMLPEDLVKSQAVYEDTLREGRDAFDTEFRIHRLDDGTLHYIRGSGIVLRDNAGQAVRMTGINWDITEERVREETLATALVKERELSDKARAGERAKSEFLAVMSHEIRTPLNGILGFSELLAQTPNLPMESKDYAQTIISSGEALLRILDDILDFSRLEAERLPIEKICFAPHEILGDIHTLLAQKAKDKELAFGVSIDETIPKYLEADAGRLRQILLNLTGNAIKFTEHGCVTLGLRLSPDVGNYEFYVKDTGLGIASDQLQRIFEPFIQADSTISRRYGGTGLGLSISRRLAELMGGKLNVRSRTGEGSEFILTMPSGAAESPFDVTGGVPTESLDAEFALRHSLRILVVEDDKVNLKLTLLLIKRLGYEPLAAKDGREAVAIYEQAPPDCILMDLQMPEMDGIEAARQIREMERTSHLPPAFISAYTANISPVEKQRCFDVGMNHYLNKPLRLSQLAQVLKMVEGAF